MAAAPAGDELAGSDLGSPCVGLADVGVVVAAFLACASCLVLGPAVVWAACAVGDDGASWFGADATCHQTSAPSRSYLVNPSRVSASPCSRSWWVQRRMVWRPSGFHHSAVWVAGQASQVSIVRSLTSHRLTLCPVSCCSRRARSWRGWSRRRSWRGGFMANAPPVNLRLIAGRPLHVPSSDRFGTVLGGSQAREDT